MSDLKFDQILDEYVRFCNDSGKIDLNLYEEYNVKRGLRDSNGRGVLTGLTEVSDVMGFSVVDGHRVPIPGELYFQGYEVQQLVQGFRNSQYGFEETTYLLCLVICQVRNSLTVSRRCLVSFASCQRASTVTLS